LSCMCHIECHIEPTHIPEETKECTYLFYTCNCSEN
jgi:hypothetical protein